MLTTFFSGKLRTYVNISVASVDQIPYEEFIRSIPKMTILNVISMEPLEGKILMEVNPNIAYSMMDRLLGGKGNSDVQPDSLTDRKSTRLNSSHVAISYAVFCLKKKKI